MAKTFLKNNFLNSVKALAEKKHWKDTFKDQLHCEYKDWLYSSICQNLTNKKSSKTEQDSITKEQFTDIAKEKMPIKTKVQYYLS